MNRSYFRWSARALREQPFCSGIMGYGVYRHVHRNGLFGVSDERPIAIAVVDQEEALRKALNTIRPMVRQGLILLTSRLFHSVTKSRMTGSDRNRNLIACFDFCMEEIQNLNHARGRRFDAPALHYELGEPCRLLLLHLRDARVATLEAEKIVTIENETTFNDYIEWLRAQGREEIVLLSEGQANWAVVRLLRLLTEAAPGLPLVHWGDMDRFGVLILRSLRRRTGLPIEPCWMDEATFRRCLPAGLPLPAGELKEIESLVAATPEETGAGLLRAIAATGVWIEQEAVASDVLR
jgi:hypothetical protein